MTTSTLFSAQDYFTVIFSIMKLREIINSLVSSNRPFHAVL